MLDPARMQFTQQTRRLVDDEDNRSLNCRGCLFHRQPYAVCARANVEAKKRGLRDCDAVDQFGEVAIYVATDIDPRQMDLIGDQQ